MKRLVYLLLFAPALCFGQLGSRLGFSVGGGSGQTEAEVATQISDSVQADRDRDDALYRQKGDTINNDGTATVYDVSLKADQTEVDANKDTLDNIRHGVYNVKNYGAVGDGATDDSLAINNAIIAASDAGGGTVFFPAGIYATTGVIIGESNVKLLGEGKGLSIIKASDSWRKAIDDVRAIVTFNATTYNFSMEGITLDGNKANLTKPKSCLYGVSNYYGGNRTLYNSTFKDVEIKNTSHFGVYLNTLVVHDIVFEDSWIHQCGDTANAGGFYTYCYNFTMINCVVDSNYNQALYLNYGHNFYIYNSFFRENGTIGDGTAPGVDVRVDSNFVFIGNVVTGNENMGLILQRTSKYFGNNTARIRNVIISENLIKNNRAKNDPYCQVYLSYCENAKFHNNTVEQRNTDIGIRIVEVRKSNMDLSITYNHFLGNGSDGGLIFDADTITDILVEGNKFLNITNEGVKDKMTCGMKLEDCDPTSTRFYVLNNTIDSATYPIQINSTWDCQNMIIEDNHAPVSDAGFSGEIIRDLRTGVDKSLGTEKTFLGSTSGYATLQASAEAGAAAVINLPNVTGTLALREFQSVTYIVSDTLEVSDGGKIVYMNVDGANTLTVRTNTNRAFPVNTVITIVSIGAGQTTIVGEAGTTINSPDGAKKLRVQHSPATLTKRDTDTWQLWGDLGL